MAEETTEKVRVKVGPMVGRPLILYPAARIDAANVAEMLSFCGSWFAQTSFQVDYLWNYYKGLHPILDREKSVREGICNTVVENRAQEIVTFKVGYQLEEPAQYALRGLHGRDGGADGEESFRRRLADLDELNAVMAEAGKDSCDRDLFEWMCVCGQAYRIAGKGEGGAALSMRSLDPRCTFMVRTATFDRRPLACVWNGYDPVTGSTVSNVWTDRELIVVRDGNVESAAPHTYGRIPVVEYTLNNARMGAFEPVLPLLDAIDAIESNRLDDVEQTVQSLMKFINCDIDRDTFLEMLDLGAVKVRSYENQTADVDFITNSLDMGGVQVTKEDMVSAVASICGMPSRSGQGGASTSDTGTAVMLRDGWTLAESYAKGYELQFKRSEREFLVLALEICRQGGQTSIDLAPRDVEMTFNRRNYENIQVKSQVLTTLLNNDRVHPQDAFKVCGLFGDAEAAYLRGERWHEEAVRASLEMEAARIEVGRAAEEGEDAAPAASA